MKGAIIGDVVGSIYEFNNHRSKDFPFLSSSCFATDDSIMSLSIGKAIKESYDPKLDGWDYGVLSEKARYYMQTIGKNYPHCGFGGRFWSWIMEGQIEPYNSYGNGAAMRVTACGEIARSIEEAEKLAESVTRVSHNHPEGIKGAQATAVAIYLAKTGSTQSEIADYIQEHFYPDYKFCKEGFACDDIRPTYQFNETCQGTVPQALECFFEAINFEDAIRNAISIGGDSDTIAAITGSVAEAYFGLLDLGSTGNVRTIELMTLADGDEIFTGRLYDLLKEWEKFSREFNNSVVA